MSQEVLAVVAGDEITQEELNAFLEAVPQDRQAYVTNPEFRKQCLEQLIALRLFAKMGEEKKLDETEEYEKIVTNAKRDILAQMAMGEIMKQITVSDEDVKSFYEENTQRFAKGETIKAKHILVESEETCNTILQSIQSGEKAFEVAAQESSTCPSGANGGDLGEFGRGQMVKEFEDAALEAEIGAVVGPVKTQFGYHLIKVEAKNEAETMPFDEVKESIKGQLVQQKQNAAYMEKVKELKAQYMEN